MCVLSDPAFAERMGVCVRGLVEEEDVGALEELRGDGYPLLLAARDAALHEEGVVAAQDRVRALLEPRLTDHLHTSAAKGHGKGIDLSEERRAGRLDLLGYHMPGTLRCEGTAVWDVPPRLAS